MDPVEVTARFDEGGKVTPLSFNMKGKKYAVESTGRQWRDEAGLHVLIMAGGERVFELFYAAESLTWFLKPVGASRSLI